MTNTKIVSLAVTSVFAIGAAACTSDTSPSSTSAASNVTVADPVSDDAPFMGLAFDTGGRGDGTFNDMAGQGADNAKANLGIVVQELEATSDQDRQPNLEALVEAGNELVVAVGFAFGDALESVAADNPDTYFGWVDGYYDGPNIITTSFAEQEGSFLVGAAAALKSQTGKIGFIGGQENDLIKRFEAGYTAGAKAVNADVIVETAYLGANGDAAAWNSPDKAKEIAGAWYADGADVVYTAAGGSGRGMIEAAVEAGEGKWAIGVDNDECSFDTEEQKAHRLTSMLKRVDTAVEEMAKSVQDGTAEGGYYTFNLANNGVGYSTTCGNLGGIASQLEDFKAQIISGEISVPTSPEGM